MFTSSLFLISQTHTEFFNCTEHILYILIFHRVKWCCIFTFTYAKRRVLISSKIVSRINKIHEILWKLHFRRETIAFFRTFRGFYMSHGPRTIKHSRLFRITSKILKVGTYHFTIIKRNITIIFREYFSSLRFDSDKKFKIIIFFVGGQAPHTVYLIFHCACIIITTVIIFVHVLLSSNK